MRALFVLPFLATGAVAATSGEEGRFIINPIGGQAFEVIEVQQMGAAEFWCAAAVYVERRTRRSETTTIYLSRARGASQTMPGRKAVGFTTDPTAVGDPRKSLSVTVTRPGVMMKSAQARRFCRDAFTRSTK